MGNRMDTFFLCLPDKYVLPARRFIYYHPDTFYIPSFGMYIPSFGMYIPNLGMYIPSLGMYIPNLGMYIPSLGI